MKQRYGFKENLTLTMAELSAYRDQGPGQRAGRRLRFYCPVHGSDNQRSLSLNPDTGRFQCYACGAWGYLAEKREEWQRQQSRERPIGKGSGWGKKLASRSRPAPPPSTPQEPVVNQDLAGKLAEFHQALPKSWGEEYLRRRRIPLEVARSLGVGYAAPGKWPSKKRDWKWGRLVFPHTNSAGKIVNLYGRAVGSNEKVPKHLRHDHLPGYKGLFNASALSCSTVFICEGVFDVLSLAAAGHLEPGRREACALFGLDGLRWHWVKARRVVFAFDQDTAGSKWRELAWQGRLLGKQVYFLSSDTYGGHKDLNEVWAATGVLDIGAWAEPPEEVNQKHHQEDVGETLERALAGHLEQPVQLPVAPTHRDLLGDAVWLCPDRKSAETIWEASGGDSLICEPQELVRIMGWLRNNHQDLEVLLAAKKLFGGTFI